MFALMKWFTAYSRPMCLPVYRYTRVATAALMQAAATLALLCPLTVHGQDIQLRPVRIPNDVSYWPHSGFVEMVPPIRLPTDKRNDDSIRVWLRIPAGGKITVQWLANQKRNTLKFPSGTVADRVETMKSQQKAMHVINGIEDVRGARIGVNGEIWFHVYELAPGQFSDWLRGYEWLRTDPKGDDLAADSLIKLFYPGAPPAARPEMATFRRLNQCGACHQFNQPMPIKVMPKSGKVGMLMSDADGFFQPITVLTDIMTVRDHRNWDLNADDPFITVWCGSQKTTAVTEGEHRGYRCPDRGVPTGKLDLVAALKHQDAHALRVCASRKYLYRHMDQKGREAFGRFFAECAIP